MDKMNSQINLCNSSSVLENYSFTQHDRRKQNFTMAMTVTKERDKKNCCIMTHGDDLLNNQDESLVTQQLIKCKYISMENI